MSANQEKKEAEKKKALTFTVGTRCVYTHKVLPNHITCDLQIACKVSPCGEKSEELSNFSAFFLFFE